MMLADSTGSRTGLVRRQPGKGIRSLTPQRKRVSDEKPLAGIRGRVVPPAWTNVWISLRPDGHRQTTGRSAA